MILSSINDYLYAWQLPIYGVFFIGWIFGTGWLYARSLNAIATNRKYTYGHGVLVAFLSGFTGAAAAGILGLALLKYFVSKTETLIVGGVPCLLLFVFFAFQTVLVMHRQMETRAVLRATVMPLSALLLFTAVLAAVIVPLTLSTRAQAEEIVGNIKAAQGKFKLIYRALDKRRESPPESLQQLVETDGTLEPGDICDPVNSSAGFCYLPTVIKRIPEKDQIIMCTFQNEQYGDKRVVLFMDGKITSLNESGFQNFLRDEKNTEFAELLKKSEPSP